MKSNMVRLFPSIKWYWHGPAPPPSHWKWRGIRNTWALWLYHNLLITCLLRLLSTMESYLDLLFYSKDAFVTKRDTALRSFFNQKKQGQGSLSHKYASFTSNMICKIWQSWMDKHLAGASDGWVDISLTFLSLNRQSGVYRNGSCVPNVVSATPPRRHIRFVRFLALV